MGIRCVSGRMYGSSQLHLSNVKTFADVSEVELKENFLITYLPYFLCREPRVEFVA